MKSQTYHALLEEPLPEWIAMHLEAGNEIYCAARPLWGHDTEDSWNLPFIRGRHYAAIDPEGDRAEELRERNSNLDASRIVFITEQQAYEAGCELCSRYPDVDVTDPSLRKEIVRMGLDMVNDRD